MNKSDFRTQATPIKRLLAILMLFFSLFFCCSCNILEELEPSNFDDEAIAVAKYLIKNDLKNPDSANWNECRIELKDDYNRYVVYVDVSAQNGFGGYNRNRYYVGFRIDENGETYYYTKYLPYIDATGAITLETAKGMFFKDWGQPPEQ